MDLRARTDDADLVRAAQAGDGEAFGVLFDRWSTRVVDVAYRIVRDREVAAEVAQDAFLAAWTGLDRLEQVESFGGWVLRIGRNRALNRLERERRSVPVGDEEATDMMDRRTEPADEAGDAAAGAENTELVWAAATALGPRDASVLDLHLRHGLAPAEIAEELGVTANTAHQVLFRLRARLGDAVRACVLWRAGHPACPELAGAVAAAGISAFGADAVRVIGVHAAGCAECAGRQEARLSPEALFAAVPLLVVAPEVLAAIRSGLADAGVPVGPGPSGSPAPPPDGSAGGSAGGSAPDADPPGRMSARRPAVIAVAAGVLVLVVVAILMLGDDGPEPEEVAADGTTSASTTDGSTESTERPSSSTTSTTTDAPPQGASSLPSPIPSSTTTTTGPNADIGTVSEPGFTPNPTTTRPPAAPTTTTSTTTTTPPPAAPTIISFTATRVPGPGCATPSQRVALSWRTSGADDVRITGPGAPSGPRPEIGTGQGCSAGPGTYVLTASGPGGSVSRTVTVPA
jgi:RNA polymerase sigma factor (sigma-70 family)